jgi:hypothetical protein
MPGRGPVLRRPLKHRKVANDVWFLLAQSLSTYLGRNPENGVIGFGSLAVALIFLSPMPVSRL